MVKNRAYFNGKLVDDPTISKGKKTDVCYFKIVTERSERDDSNSPKFCIVPCKAFGEIANYIHQHYIKDNLIKIDGYVRDDKYTNKNGQIVYSCHVYVENVTSPEYDNSDKIVDESDLMEIDENEVFDEGEFLDEGVAF